ncbi:MAG: TIGR03936 family radical SAM-associated protein [Clostridiales bacterium]|nr:TIGR03936 family radical SAM-associated protein [Clostridiales bacterium]
MAGHKNRLLFRKEGRGVYISHLDLMALFQRAFLRAGVAIWQTRGYNRHSFVSLPLPLSVGYSSQCELLEFTLESDTPLEEIPARLNATLPEGIVVERCYEAETPAKRLAAIDWTVGLEYDNGTPEGALPALEAFFTQESCVIQKPSKKSKKGYTELDLIPMVYQWDAAAEDCAVNLHLRLMAQNPGLNPAVLVNTLAQQRPALTPDFARYHRNEIYGADGGIFR